MVTSLCIWSIIASHFAFEWLMFVFDWSIPRYYSRVLKIDFDGVRKDMKTSKNLQNLVFISFLERVFRDYSVAVLLDVCVVVWNVD